MLSVSEGACLQALLCYAPLPSLSVHIPNGFPPIMKDQRELEGHRQSWECYRTI